MCSVLVFNWKINADNLAVTAHLMIWFSIKMFKKTFRSVSVLAAVLQLGIGLYV